MYFFNEVLNVILPGDSCSGANATHSVVYQDEEGQWVTDLAYYSSFQKEMDGKTGECDDLLQNEDFVPASTYNFTTLSNLKLSLVFIVLFLLLCPASQVMLWKK